MNDQDRRVHVSAAASPWLCQKRHLNQIELARRWSLSERTLERWRWLKKGPSYLRLGGRVAYRLEDIEAFEAKQLRQLQPAGGDTRGPRI
jgi:hypothetical protein